MTVLLSCPGCGRRVEVVVRPQEAWCSACRTRLLDATGKPIRPKRVKP